MGQMIYAITLLLLWLSSIAAYFTHIVWGVRLLGEAVSPATEQVVLGVLGAVMPPVGIIHGWVIWFS